MTKSPQRKHPLAECESCPLVNEKCAPTTGPEDAKIAFVSRSPGYHDAKRGKPFAGPSGVVLDHLLKRYGINRDEILTTNVVLCETDDPPLQAIKACQKRLETEIANCDTVVAGGVEAVRYLHKYRGLTASRAFVHNRTTITGHAQRVIATNNPAMVLRNSDAFPDMIADFRLAFDPLPPPTFPNVEIINEPVKARAVLRQWNDTSFGTLASDLEWAGTTIFAAGFSRSGSKSVVFGRNAIDDVGNFSLLREFYERSDIRFVWHNGKADTKILRQNGVRARVDEDTFLLSYALDEEPGRHTLEYLLMREFGWPDYEPASVKHFKKTGEFLEPVKISERELYKYNGWDAAGTLQLYDLLRRKAHDDSVLERPYTKYLLPASNAFTKVELRGFRYDAEAAANLNEREVLPRLWALEDDMRHISGQALLNCRSPKQLQAVYYNHYGIKHGLKDTGKKKLSTSTGAEVRKEILDGRYMCKPQLKDSLVEFAATHDIFQKIDKQRGTYIEGLIERTSRDGRVYCWFNIGGTVTGRSSSKEPNLQNITREGREGIPGIRTLFLASEGNKIVSADFSQAELRTCAFLSGDTNLLDIYRDSERSLHRERAKAFYGENYTKEEYVKSKNINFGVTYGQSAGAFAQMYHMPEKEAQAYIDSWWQEFPRLQQWVKSIWRKAQKDGVIVSPFGHKRRFHLITRENIGDVLRESVNFLPQNIAGWLTISALTELVLDYDVDVVASVHDSIVADVHSDRIMETAKLMKEVMEAQPMKQLGWDLPFTVDISVGPNWGTLEELEIHEHLRS